jgi:glycosyltransferase involved in cell wall biosynthesis
MVPSGLLFAFLCAVYGVPHIVTVHAADYYLLMRLPFGRSMVRAIARRSKALIPVNATMAEGIRALRCSAEVHVMPMGFDPTVFQAGPQPETPVLRRKLGLEDKRCVLYVGKLTEKKGVVDLIAAMVALQDAFPDLRLLIAGDGVLRQHLAQQAKDLGVADRVAFLGSIPHSSIAVYYHIAHVVAVPSHPDRHGETEGMPVVVLEALASGTPVVGSVFCSVPRELVRAGFTEVPGPGPGPLAAFLATVLNGTGSGVNAEIVQRYSWERVSGFYASVIRRYSKVSG